MPATPGPARNPASSWTPARLGVPLIVSEHDPALSARLHGQPWALTFPAGDPDALADALRTVIRQPPEYPGPQAPGLLGMRSAAEQADFLTRPFAPLRTKES
ncbi:glycosyltransferase [Streptomyces sp. NPDC002573]|uniref:glycosyltransferase n=1 Tax=Streptomyces sp. NPDC002573 TaxID=3364651 RepID=UPI0036A9551C